MQQFLRELDSLLRGERTSRLDDGEIQLSIARFALLAIILGIAYGFFMGWFAAFGDHPDGWKQLLATSVKLPALFLLTLAITFPSLYVFNALVGARLTFRSTLRLLVAAVVVNLAVAASLGPILAFFTLSTTSYAFMIVLNVALLGISGFIGLRFLLRALHALSVARFAESHVEATDTPEHETKAPNAAGNADTESTGSAEPRTPASGSVRVERLAATKRDTPIRPQQDSSINAVFVIWIMLYGIVGAQMGWILRPFIGNPELPFALFRQRESNFLQGLLRAIEQLAGG